MKEIVASLSGCSLCGICLAVCPVYKLTGKAGDGPRGKIAILRAVASGSLSLRDASEPLSRCVLCGACSRVCPADVPASRAFERARAQIPKKRRNFREWVFDFLVARPRLWSSLQTPIYQIWRAREYLPPPFNRLGESLPAPREKFSLANPIAREGKKTVLLWPGCLTSRALPGILEACLVAIERAGFAAILLDQPPCCGRPALLAGGGKKVLEFATEGLKLLSTLKFDYLATPCPGCLANIREIWPNLFEAAGEFKKDADDLASRALHINALFAQFGSPPKAGQTLVWHTPCLAMNRPAENGSWDIGDPASVEGCCGACAPSSQPELARALGQDCRDRLRATGKTDFASSCPSCVATLRRVLKKNADRATIRHSIEILADSLMDRAPDKPEVIKKENKKSPDATATGEIKNGKLEN